MSTIFPRVRIAIDRGGTFTDIYAEVDSEICHNVEDVQTERIVLKLLSEDPKNYDDAPTEGIRRVLQRATGKEQSRDEPVDTSHIQSIRMGTTIATNALLERKGEPCALIVTEGLKDILAIGNQVRPNLFDLRVQRMPPLCHASVEARERVILDKASNVYHRHADHLHMPINVRRALDEDHLVRELNDLRDRGIKSIAVALMHSYAFKDHENRVRDIAVNHGFTNVSVSSELTPRVKIVPRAFTATVDAYLTPKVRQYIEKFRSGFLGNLCDVDVQLMQSDGGLCDIGSFSGYLAILSGPAGGVVGYGKSLFGYEKHCVGQGSSVNVRPLIGFDMGGTSTDVSRYSGRFEHVFETETAGVTIQAPQLDILTVAAGGGSRLFYRNNMFYVGPESAGATPGPVCYRKGGYLTVTDANLVLGRIQPALFPCIFGEGANQPLDLLGAQKAFLELTGDINKNLATMNETTMTAEEIADGFIRVANEAMCRPIRQLTESKGYDVRDHSLACFGGAGGQHACAIARSLGIGTVLIHKYSGVLSAYGIALADSVTELQDSVNVSYKDKERKKEVFAALSKLRCEAEGTLKARGFRESDMRFELYLDLRYDGTDFGAMVQCPEGKHNCPELVDFDVLFVEEYSREHGFHIPGRPIIIDNIRVRGLGNKTHSGLSRETPEVLWPSSKSPGLGSAQKFVGEAKPALTTKCYFADAGGWLSCEIWHIKDLPQGTGVLPGPCVIVNMSAGSTIVVDPGSIARLTSDGSVVISVEPFHNTRHIAIPTKAKTKLGSDNQVDPVKLSIYSHRFMSIAEQMGRTLQRTSISTNMKERLDFSCALFDEKGALVANAPHVPVHLGAMQDAVRFQIRTQGSSWRENEVILTNHPAAGGSHLPDITVITPVYHQGSVVFYVASRGHHADIGGTTPGSMPPWSETLADEGLAVQSLRIVKDGLFQEREITALLRDAGCRCIEDVISDIRAQVAANKKGINLVKDLITADRLTTVQSYMHYIQDAARRAVKNMLRKLCPDHESSKDHELRFRDYMDDGTMINLQIRINREEGTALFDFSGSGDEVKGNTNAPIAVTASAIIYALRCLVDEDIPLNQGCMDPITIYIPSKSILSPSCDAAVVGGNVLTSQRVTDVILGAFGACAASQGCMNNFTFGDKTMGYYETIAGGSGAGPGWNGASGVQCHMTNTRITDPEVIERRYPVILREFSLRRNSGGSGKWHGGDGVVRTLEFTKTLTVSILSERRKYRPWGLAGGDFASPGKNELIRANGSITDLGGKNSFEVENGDVVTIRTPGGGGWGKPSTS